MISNNEFLFEKLEFTRYNLSIQIAEKIQEMIESKNLKPGIKLPSERNLANKLGVNRITLNKAILILEQKGIVKIKIAQSKTVRETAFFLAVHRKIKIAGTIKNTHTYFIPGNRKNGDNSTIRANCIQSIQYFSVDLKKIFTISY